ncbi:hypothetical protein [Ignavibacterium sp.]|jgi:hypothetical protein|uniref:hypothetical protein n=1 Tax=Ignavibacterium sp. TaxID=2651167 RepID=UPI0025C598CF|nr:hypothetical protein [Ignavibacterium sp.]
MNKWFAIFKTGKHTDSNGNEREWTENDLDKIIESYDKTKHEAPIVIGHPKTNAPAFGWIEKLKRVGDTLYALPSQLAQEFVEMVNKGLFKKRSISLYPDGTLRHVGFLGAQPPAVKGLPDAEFKEDENLSTIETEVATDFEDKSVEKNLQGLEEKVKQYELQLKKMEEKEKEFEELQTKYAQVLVEKSTLEKEIQKQKRETQLKDFAEIVERAISEGKLLPKMKDTITKLYEVVSLTPLYEFSEGVKSEPSSLLTDLINSMPKIIDFGESGKPAEGKENDLPASKIVAEEIRRQMKN